MGFGQDLARFEQTTTARLAVFADAVQDEALKELGRRLADVLPDLAPIDSGLLARSFTFRLEDDRLIVGNDAFYARAIVRFGGNHDLVETIEREALAIVNDAGFRRLVQDRALRRV